MSTAPETIGSRKTEITPRLTSLEVVTLVVLHHRYVLSADSLHNWIEFALGICGEERCHERIESLLRQGYVQKVPEEYVVELGLPTDTPYFATTDKGAALVTDSRLTVEIGDRSEVASTTTAS
jgi:hypothetical protein